MGYFSKKLHRIFLIDAFIILLCIMGVVNIGNKANLPFGTKTKNKSLIINDESIKELEANNYNVIISVDNTILSSTEELEILLDSKLPGEKVKIILKKHDEELELETELIPFYSTLYIVIACVVGLLFIIVALFILIKSEDRDLGKTTHWAFIFTSIIILMTWGNYSMLPFGVGLATRTAFHFAYLFAPIFFLKFSLIFPKKHKLYNSKILNHLNKAAFLLAILLSLVFINLTNNNNIDNIKLYIVFFNISSIFIFIVTITAISTFVHSYSTADSETERKKLRWILLGFIVGPLSYLFLWVIPSRIWNSVIISESLVLFLIAFVPITFGISIFKYRLLNIDIIIKRGLVYSSIIILLLIIYVTVLSITAQLLNYRNSELASIITAVSIALLFQPAKQKIRKFVDKKFFRIEYDYRQAINIFNRQTKNIHDPKALFKKVIALINNLIPVSKLGYFQYDSEARTVMLQEHLNFEAFQDINIKICDSSLINGGSPVITTSNNIEPAVERLNRKLFENEEISNCLIFNLKSQKFLSHGFLILGEKKSETNFTAEDVDLISNISSNISLSLDRIRLQKEVVKEHLESQRLEELNKLKSFLVSSVSHDLKTPLTSIKLFAERLKTSNNISLEKANEYLEIIEGESDRLTRLINNVLDYSKIENGIQEYNLEKINLVKLVENVLKILDYQIKMNNFKIFFCCKSKQIEVWVDKDAVSEALINLITNAIKFSDKEKEITVLLEEENKQVKIIVVDNGRGIARKNINNIFNPFYKTGKFENEKLNGAGLGLAIVKHIMNAHNGSVTVESAINKGSKFTLIFPRN